MGKAKMWVAAAGMAAALGASPARALGPLEWFLLQGAFNWALSHPEAPAAEAIRKAGPSMQTTARWAGRLAERGVIDLGPGARLGLAQALAPGALGFEIRLDEPSGKIDRARMDATWAPGLKSVVCARGSFWRTWLMAGGSLTYRVVGSDGGQARIYYAQEKDCAGL